MNKSKTISTSKQTVPRKLTDQDARFCVKKTKPHHCTQVYTPFHCFCHIYAQNHISLHKLIHQSTDSITCTKPDHNTLYTLKENIHAPFGATNKLVVSKVVVFLFWNSIHLPLVFFSPFTPFIYC